LAKDVGAHIVVLAGEGLRDRLSSAVTGRGVDLVLDHVGSRATTAVAAEVTRPGGEIRVIGVGAGSVAIGYGASAFDVGARFPFWGSLPELHEVIELGRSGNVRARTEVFPLDEAVEVYRRLDAGSILGRAVIVP
jgi:propanol-preferring alcohol dehydrogenase